MVRRLALWLVSVTVFSGAEVHAQAAPPASDDTQAYCQNITQGVEAQAPLVQACKYAQFVFRTLPNIICNQKTERYTALRDNSQVRDVALRDVVTAKVSYVHGHSTFSDIEIDGKPASAPPSDSGAWVTGDFGPFLALAFLPQGSKTFISRTQLDRANSLLFGFEIAKENNSSWQISAHEEWAAASTMYPGVKGRIWLDEATSKIQRLDTEAIDLGNFPVQQVSIRIYFSSIPFPDGNSFVLPSASDAVICYGKLGRCEHSVARYYDCHRFAATSRIYAVEPDTQSKQTAPGEPVPNAAPASTPDRDVTPKR